MYPLILIICWSWLWQKRIFEFFGKETSSSWMDPLNLALTSLSGAFNGIVYGYSTFGKELFTRICLCQNNKENENNLSLIAESMDTIHPNSKSIKSLYQSSTDGSI